ncbi:MAG: NADH-quinone oxidoreductase subunit NuoG [Alphaproteobacteria bacterium]
MVKLTINNKTLDVENGITVLQACEIAGIEVPRFCYHERLSIAGNCRMCLVEMENSGKPVASCAMPVAEGMNIKTNSELVEKARNGVMEFLLINHPLDCPICDQGGECDLQDQAMAYGKGFSRFNEGKRAVSNKNLGPLIKTHMTRCIHCTRCVRFNEEIAGNYQLGAIGRGENTEITSFLEKNIDSELSGNVIDLCPVGALTSKPYAFIARPWELKKTDSIDVFDALGSNIRVDSKGDKVLRVLPRINEDINQEWISDKTRFAYDGLNHQRLDRFYFREKDAKLVEISEEKSFDILKNKLLKTKDSKLFAIVGNTLDCESVFSFKLLLDKLNFKNYDCRQDQSFFIPSKRFSYLFNSTISGIDESDLCILVGTDLRKEAPLINARLRQRIKYSDEKFQVFNFGEKRKTNLDSLNIGSDYYSLNNLKSIKYKKLLKKSKKPIFIIGQGPLISDDAENLFYFLLDIYNKSIDATSWSGFNVLQNYSGRVGALDLKFYNAKNMNKNSVNDIYNGKYDVLYLFSADELDFEKIPSKTFVIYQGHHGDRAVKRADLIIPTSCFTEKEGIYVNMEGRPQISRQVKMPISGVSNSWNFFRKLSKYLNVEIGYENFSELRSKMFIEAPHLSRISILSDNNLPNLKAPKVKLSKNLIKASIDNFYMTDSVSRNSPVMSSCSSQMLKKL